jgi:hypothetical protein
MQYVLRFLGLVLLLGNPSWTDAQTFQQGSSAAAVPPFGGFDVNSGATAAFSTQSGSFFFRQGSAGAALPPFGGFVPGEEASFSFGRAGAGGSGSIRLFAGQGNSASSTSQSAAVTVPNGGFGALSSGTFRPFVTGFVPFVGSYVPGDLPAANGLDPRNGVANADWQIAGQVRDARREAAVQRLMERAERAEMAGNRRTARKFYAMAFRQATGATRATLEERIRRLKR